MFEKKIPERWLDCKYGRKKIIVRAKNSSNFGGREKLEYSLAGPGRLEII